MKTITISLCDRPYYTKILLDNLNSCYGIDKYNIGIFVEPVDKEVVNLALSFRKNQTKVYINRQRLGCSHNIFNCLYYGFDVMKSSYHIHFEDDTIPSKDCLNFFEWCDSQYLDDETVFSITGYNKIKKIKESDKNLVKRTNWYTPWGWATWKSRWQNGYKEDLWKRINSTPYKSWDCHTNDIRQNRFEIQPIIPRIQNIGAKNGFHVPNEQWHFENQYNELWIESIKSYVDKNNFKETFE
jgi:hypothetical protein